MYCIIISAFWFTFTATGNEIFIVPSKTGVDCVEALGNTLVLSHQNPVLQVPEVHSLKRRWLHNDWNVLHDLSQNMVAQSFRSI